MIPKEGLIRLRTQSAGARVLVVSENYQSNWSVWVDGEEAEMVRVHYIWKGVALPAGEHEVEFRYFRRCWLGRGGRDWWGWWWLWGWWRRRGGSGGGMIDKRLKVGDICRRYRADMRASGWRRMTNRTSRRVD